MAEYTKKVYSVALRVDAIRYLAGPTYFTGNEFFANPLDSRGIVYTNDQESTTEEFAKHVLSRLKVSRDFFPTEKLCSWMEYFGFDAEIDDHLMAAYYNIVHLGHDYEKYIEAAFVLDLSEVYESSLKTSAGLKAAIGELTQLKEEVAAIPIANARKAQPYRDFVAENTFGVIDGDATFTEKAKAIINKNQAISAIEKAIKVSNNVNEHIVFPSPVDTFLDKKNFDLESKVSGFLESFPEILRVAKQTFVDTRVGAFTSDQCKRFIALTKKFFQSLKNVVSETLEFAGLRLTAEERKILKQDLSSDLSDNLDSGLPTPKGEVFKVNFRQEVNQPLPGSSPKQ